MTATFYVGDAIETMGKLPENSVDLILSSPPFLALRSYLPSDDPNKHLEGGSQSTPGEYVDWLLDVVEACARVLAPHGSLCFELGDTYASDQGRGTDWVMGGARFTDEGLRSAGRDGGQGGQPTIPGRRMNTVSKYGGSWPLAKSLSLIPESFRWAMVYGHNPHTGRRTEPWRLRNVIRWVRPNPPVGALGDKFRPATSELMVFCKAKDRYFDLDSVREANPRINETANIGQTRGGEIDRRILSSGMGNGQQNPAGAPPLDWWNIPLLEGEEPTRMGPKEKPRATNAGPLRSRAEGSKDSPNLGGDTGTTWAPGERMELNPIGAPPLDWWNIPPGGFKGAHYAVWPPELLVKPVKAMCPEQVCRTCGEPRRRIVDVSYTPHGDVERQHAEPKAGARGRSRVTRTVPESVLREQNSAAMANGRATKIVETLGFSDCGHNDWRPGLILDPFAGSGTTLSVATGHGRDAIGIDLDERNFDLALDRVGPLILERVTL